MNMLPAMKILHIIDSAGLYGAEIMLLNLMEEQRRMNLAPMLISLCDLDCQSNEMIEEAKKRELTAFQFKMKRGYSLSSAMKLVRQAQEAKVAIIHSHGYKGDILLGSLPRYIRGIPMVRTQHGRTSTKKLSKIWFYEVLDWLIMRRMAAVVRVNKADVSHKNSKYFPGDHSCVIENGIPGLKFEPESVMRTDPEVSEFCKDGFVIGTIARLSEEKGLTHLIAALRIISRENTEIKAVIIGEGPLRQSLEAMVSEAGLSGRILFAGYRDYAYNYLPHFRIFVLPSLTEGLPITILEAMQAKIPIIASRVGGIPAVLENGKMGILVEPGNPNALAEAITRVWSDPQGSLEMVQRARETALTKYSSKRMAEDYLCVYNMVLRKAGATDD
jgi:glycosyltransferase involved in cell wall biosynthesis